VRSGAGCRRAGEATTGFAAAVAKRDIAFEAGFEAFREGERHRLVEAIQNAGPDPRVDLLAEYDWNATDYLDGLPPRQQRRFRPEIDKERPASPKVQDPANMTDLERLHTSPGVPSVQRRGQERGTLE
jgi:hypothetical protein